MTETDRALAIMDAVCGRLTASHDYARGADAERARIAAHIREAAGRIMGEVMRAPGLYDLKTAEIAATAMEETAAAIETGDHWRDFT